MNAGTRNVNSTGSIVVSMAVESFHILPGSDVGLT